MTAPDHRLPAPFKRPLASTGASIHGRTAGFLYADGSKRDERGRRLFAASETRAAGWSGLVAVSEIPRPPRRSGCLIRDRDGS